MAVNKDIATQAQSTRALNLLDLIQSDGFTFKKVASTNSGEYAGACPWCGGRDRFIICQRTKAGGTIAGAVIKPAMRSNI